MLSQSTAFALPKVFQSKRIFFKIFWLIYFFGGSSVTVLQVTLAINRYFDYEVITQIKSVYSYLKKQSNCILYHSILSNCNFFPWDFFLVGTLFPWDFSHVLKSHKKFKMRKQQL